MQHKATKKIAELAQKQLNIEIATIEALPASASPRKYYRLLTKDNQSYIGVHGNDQLENKTFIELANWFRSKELNVPEVFVKNDEFYIQEDLGNESLYGLVQKHWLNSKEQTEFPSILLEKYQSVIKELIQWQTKGTEHFDFELCKPVQAFDAKALHWDFNYFKYYFAKLCGIPFDESALQTDFDKLCAFLMKADRKYFMHRDFQSRNILFKAEKPYFIDFQSGRRGPLYYDLASLLYQSSVQLPEATREALFNFYLEESAKEMPVETHAVEFFYGFVGARLLQVLGAYGFRGLLEKKPYFLKSIPNALHNINYLFNSGKIPLHLPALQSLFQNLNNSGWAEQFRFELPENELTVSIHSFSYKKKGFPFDLSGNGGGFMFDCRAIHNPGRYDAYKQLTGRDKGVIDFLEEEGEILHFFENAKAMVDASIQKYMKRNFQHLQVGFGCTGGQHRSVYCAEKLFDYLNNKYPIRLRLSHDEQNIFETN